LHHYWPNAEQFTDITKSDFTKYENKIDVLTGGFPCQPFSTSGEQLGEEDERYLFPEMLRAIREIKPRWIVAENVLGITQPKFKGVLTEIYSSLEASGYKVQAFVIPASAFNAPHERYRVWFVAYSGSIGVQVNQTGALFDFNGNNKGEARTGEQQGRIRAIGEEWTSTDTTSKGLQRREWTPKSIRSESGNKISNWSDWPTQSPVCNGNDGVPAGLDTTAFSFSQWRNESIKAGGNAIVPQAALQFFKAIEQYELLTYKTIPQ
jgi:DNA (cytosine-5)-methyltransferase 1